MKEFMGKDFLINSETGKYLYNHHAMDMPIYDYHCHLSPKEIYEDLNFTSLTEIWLGGDHYKWRAMRTHGIPEEFISGNGDDLEKFKYWAETVQHAFGNPLYHWTHMELKTYFSLDEYLKPESAEEIYEHCNNLIQSGELSVRKIIKKSNVKVICTTDDPVDDLKYHALLREDESFETKVLPTFRPDKAINIERETFIPWIRSLGKRMSCEITSFDELLSSMEKRLDFFHEMGCRLSDHALDVVEHQQTTKEEVEAIFLKGLNSEVLTSDDISKYKGYMIVFFGKAYHKRGWVMQLHIGAHRNNSTRMYKKLGPDTGYDSIHDEPFATSLIGILDSLDITGELPKTIIYTLNPRDNEVIATVIGSFQGDGIKGKVQFGSGWWFNDQIDGMNRQMEALQQLGMLAHFVGMLTDSRSFLSFTRHDYFRRLLCERIGIAVEDGLYPKDLEFLGKMVENICYNNALNYFDIEV